MQPAAGRLGALVLLLCSIAATAAEYLPIAGGVFRSALPVDDQAIKVAPFRMRSQPVTNREFKAFLAAHPEWQRNRVPALLAGRGYLANWVAPDDFGKLGADAPVTAVSWHAARAYCDSEQARLPDWYEWEFTAAADATRADARQDPAWRARILQWYEHPASAHLQPVGRDANVWGITDMHGSIYEWVEDFNGLFVTTDSRSQGEQKTLQTCGAAALSLDDRENYAILMRIAMLSALSAEDSIVTVGFRCAKDVKDAP